MLSVLFTGMVISEPETGTDRRRSGYVTVRLGVLDAEGRRIEISVIAFGRVVQELLQVLRIGDEVAIAGHASLSQWQTDAGAHKAGLNVVARRVMALQDLGEHLTPQERPSWLSSAPEGAASGSD